MRYLIAVLHARGFSMCGTNSIKHLLRHFPTKIIQRQEIWQGEVNFKDKLYVRLLTFNTTEFATKAKLTIYDIATME